MKRVLGETETCVYHDRLSYKNPRKFWLFKKREPSHACTTGQLLIAFCSCFSRKKQLERHKKETNQ